MITARNINLSFGTKQILHNVDINVPYGEILALCGPNGAGKSTLLSVLAGDAPKAQGSVYYGKDALADLTPVQMSKRRAVLEQSPSLTARFSVDELVRLSVPIELPPQETSTLVDSVLAELGLTYYQHAMVDTLSGGQRHRAHLARVLGQLRANRHLHGPNFLFLDEPTASLDVLHQIEVMKIARAQAKQGSGVLVVLHDLNLAAAFADQVLLMQDGHVHKAGSVSDVFQSHVLTEVYKTPIVVEQSDNHPLFIHPDFSSAA